MGTDTQSATAKQKVDCYLYNVQGQADVLSATLIATMSAYSEDACKNLKAPSSFNDLISQLGAVKTCLNAAVGDTKENATQAVSTAIVAATKLNDSLTPAGVQGQGQRPIVSTWQGVYGASELTNLAGLPARVERSHRPDRDLEGDLFRHGAYSHPGHKTTGSG